MYSALKKWTDIYFTSSGSKGYVYGNDHNLQKRMAVFRVHNTVIMH